MNICQYVSIKHKIPSIFFALDTSAHRVGLRMLASLARVEMDRLNTGDLEDEDWRRVSACIQHLRDVPMQIDAGPALTPAALYAKVAAAKESHAIGLVVIDYVHLMTSQDSQRNEAEQLAESSRRLKAMAKELQLTMIALSPLNRSPTYRPDGRPSLTDLRGAGALEDDADAVLLLHRPGLSDDPRLTEVLVAKNRNGREGSTPLRFFPEYARFDSPLEQSSFSRASSSSNGATDKGPINALYLSKALELGYSESEMLSHLESVGLLARNGSNWRPTEDARAFLHPQGHGSCIWSRSVIDFLKSPR